MCENTFLTAQKGPQVIVNLNRALVFCMEQNRRIMKNGLVEFEFHVELLLDYCYFTTLGK